MTLMLNFILTVLAAFLATFLYDRFKRPTPRYSFEFEKEVPYQVGNSIGFFSMGSAYLENYIYLENYGEVWLFDVATQVYCKNKKERSRYQIMGITENLFNLEIEDLSTPLPLEYRLNHPKIPLLPKSKEETIKEKTTQLVDLGLVKFDLTIF